MRIMASQLANGVDSIKLPDCWYTQSGEQTKRKLHKNHFPGFDIEGMTLEEQVQPTLRTSAAHREDQELSRKV